MCLSPSGTSASWDMSLQPNHRLPEMNHPGWSLTIAMFVEQCNLVNHLTRLLDYCNPRGLNFVSLYEYVEETLDIHLYIGGADNTIISLHR